ncbi:M-phase inducer phosphatase 3 isoform X2 [Zalophus californianus]|nr:M-phase inducer phosphatase 3 isoform X2 [Zalophus californianus]XP_027461881.1 M-phase inducer phosphatase 3 isoform X2 [Zalophus californianus]XP_027461882.1 M-phase inducer phosphatase 3 isoform X2 [Zalophus californianus]XP_027461883.1 M-phase inducer phosphatase 3 isoform X2 [Zalophus californianus]XP_027461884.1 M-phase inducer phosphatase 3 isoform X2 [Zalophus californianus]
MSAELISSTGEEGRLSSGPSFRSRQRRILNLLLERDTSFTTCPDLPRTPVNKLFGDSANLSVLSGGTPKCCLDLSNLSGGGEMSANQLSTSADIDEIGHLDSKGPQEIYLTGMNPQQHLRKCSPAQLHCSTPNALDHGNRKKDAICSSSTNKENENNTLKSSEWWAPRSVKFRKRPGGPYMSPLSLLDNGNFLESEMKYLGSPITTLPKLDKNPELEDQAEEISNELMDFSLEDQEEPKASLNRSSLYRSPSLPENLNRPRLKRVVKFKDNPVPDKEKKEYCSSHKELRKGLGLKKTVSLCDINITQMLEEDSNQGSLIGDFSKVCVLPTVSGRHQDLKYVNPETVAALLSGKFQSLIEKFYIIDCRYPYEYLGGHIQGALNLYSQEELYDFFLKKPIVPLDTRKRIIIIFHCEFSSERGPRMCRSLREEDRALNQYPALYYPELYILKGGYKDFFPEYTELCEPQSYCPMHHQDHKAELLRCQSQSKAWEGERQLQEQIALLVKDVSP